MARNSELQRWRDVGSGNLPASITATSTELNVLDGVAATLTPAELNILDGVTATAAEINKLDGRNPLAFNSDATVLQTKSDNYTGVITDAGTVIDFGAASGKTFTIPANASVPYAIGTVLVISKSGANNLTIAITSDTLISIATPEVTASGGVVMIIKVAATTWVMFGQYS
jgi:hypothetical protein